jgi:hypothetical protein
MNNKIISLLGPIAAIKKYGLATIENRAKTTDNFEILSKTGLQSQILKINKDVLKTRKLIEPRL